LRRGRPMCHLPLPHRTLLGHDRRHGPRRRQGRGPVSAEFAGLSSDGVLPHQRSDPARTAGLTRLPIFLDRPLPTALATVIISSDVMRVVRMAITVRMVDSFGPQLQGRSLGRKHYARLCELLSDAPPGEVVLLDFAGVDVVTGSWINATL